MVCGAAEICVSWGRQLLPALPDFGPERPISRLDDTNCPPSSLSTLPTIGSDHGDAPADSTSSCPAQLQLVFQQPSRVLLAALGATACPGISYISPPMPGAQNAHRGPDWPPPGATRASHSPQLRSELLGRHEQHPLHLVARPVVQAHDLAHAEVDELEQRRPTHCLHACSWSRDGPSMLGIAASWNNTE